jgi:hypothetical protein
MVKNNRSGGRKSHPFAVALKQLHPKCTLHLLHLGGERRLGHVTSKRGTPKITVVGHRHKVLGLPEGERD